LISSAKNVEFRVVHGVLRFGEFATVVVEGRCVGQTFLAK